MSFYNVNPWLLGDDYYDLAEYADRLLSPLMFGVRVDGVFARAEVAALSLSIKLAPPLNPFVENKSAFSAPVLSASIGLGLLHSLDARFSAPTFRASPESVMILKSTFVQSVLSAQGRMHKELDAGFSLPDLVARQGSQLTAEYTTPSFFARQGSQLTAEYTTPSFFARQGSQLTAGFSAASFSGEALTYENELSSSFAAAQYTGEVASLLNEQFSFFFDKFSLQASTLVKNILNTQFAPYWPAMQLHGGQTQPRLSVELPASRLSAWFVYTSSLDAFIGKAALSSLAGSTFARHFRSHVINGPGNNLKLTATLKAPAFVDTRFSGPFLEARGPGSGDVIFHAPHISATTGLCASVWATPTMLEANIQPPNPGLSRSFSAPQIVATMTKEYEYSLAASYLATIIEGHSAFQANMDMAEPCLFALELIDEMVFSGQRIGASAYQTRPDTILEYQANEVVTNTGSDPMPAEDTILSYEGDV